MPAARHFSRSPCKACIRVWYYRKDLLEQAHVQPPGSWQELKTAAQTLTNSKADQYGSFAA
jgi:ABC-type glycerol-3-phosphate transport system substrate-binding protein